MGHELKSLIQLDTRKLIWLIGITFAVIVTFQYIELPYGNVLWSLFPFGKVSVDEKSSILASGPSSTESGFYFNGTNAGNETVHDDEIFEGKDIDTDVITEADVGLNKSSTFDEGTKAWKESSTAEPVELNKNSTVDKAGNETAHDDEIFEGRDIDTDVITEADVGLNKSSTFDEGTKLWKESSTAEPVELNKNSTVDNTGNETAHDDEIFEGRDIDTDVITEADVGLNKSSTFDEGTEALKESSTAELVELNKNSTVNNAESSKSEEFEKDSNITSLNNLNQTGAVNETAKADDFTPEVGLNRSSILDKELNERSNITVLDIVESSNNKSVAEDVGKSEESFASKNDTVDNNTSNNNAPDTGLGPTNITSEKGVETNISAPVVSFNSSISSVEQHVTPSFDKNEKPKPIQNDFTKPSDNSSPRKAPKMKKKPEMLPPAVTTIADMNNLLDQSRVSYESPTPKWSSRADKVLLEARLQIENAPIIKNDPQLYAPLFRNLSMFKRSYELMENTLKVYVYKEGKRPIVHTPVLRGIYASEGWFMKQLETNKKFVTKNPRDAYLFFLEPSNKHCFSQAPSETRNHMANCIRALCNSDVREGYVFGKDVSLPETYVRNPQKPLRDLGGNPPSKRPILAFFAGSMHGYLRPILLEQWGNKDPDMKIFGKMPNVKGKMNYIRHMKSSKYCLCPRGYEVNSPRVVEAIFYECVPVIISDNFVPPFFEVLNWESFSVFILEKDIPNLKKILLSIPDKRYRQMQLRVKKIQQHFLWHPKPEKYDIFHMILHSVWYNRVFQMKPR
ncbi:hypothetical protein V6Z12_A13G220400 [Gossypium hirsutum]